jgi:NitT/TauT family transport system permease protein
MSEIMATGTSITGDIRSARSGRPVPDAILALGLMVVVTVAWELAIRLFHVPTFVLPAPSAIVRQLIESRARLASAAMSTAVEIFLGFMLASLTGVVIALVVVRFERFGRALYPLIVLFQNVPKSHWRRSLFFGLASISLRR